MSEQHVHRWRMEPPSGPVINGACACGATRQDPASPEVPFRIHEEGYRPMEMHRKPREKKAPAPTVERPKAPKPRAVKPPPPPKPEPQHGQSAMRKTGCRCDLCREYQLVKSARSREKRRVALQEGRDVPHGNLTTYRAGCRCQLCAGTASRSRRATKEKARAARAAQ